MRTCFFCKRNTKLLEAHFHSIPKDPELGKKWRDACGIDDNYKRKVYICSEHFKKTDYNPNSRTLKCNAVPTLHLHTNVESLDPECEPDNATVNTPKKIYFDDPENTGEDESPEDTGEYENPEDAEEDQNHEVAEDTGEDENPEVVEDTGEDENPEEDENPGEDENPEGDENREENEDPVEHEDINEIRLEDFATPYRAKCAINLVKNTIKRKNARIRKMKDNKQLVRKKVESVEELVTYMRENKIINAFAARMLEKRVNELHDILKT